MSVVDWSQGRQIIVLTSRFCSGLSYIYPTCACAASDRSYIHIHIIIYTPKKFKKLHYDCKRLQNFIIGFEVHAVFLAFKIKGIKYGY